MKNSSKLDQKKVYFVFYAQTELIFSYVFEFIITHFRLNIFAYARMEIVQCTLYTIIKIEIISNIYFSVFYCKYIIAKVLTQSWNARIDDYYTKISCLLFMQTFVAPFEVLFQSRLRYYLYIDFEGINQFLMGLCIILLLGIHIILIENFLGSEGVLPDVLKTRGTK